MIIYTITKREKVRKIKNKPQLPLVEDQVIFNKSDTDLDSMSDSAEDCLIDYKILDSNGSHNLIQLNKKD